MGCFILLLLFLHLHHLFSYPYYYLFQFAFLFFSLFVTKHPFHLVSSSPWPIFSSISLLLILTGFLLCLGSGTMSVLVLGIASLVLCCFSWFKDIIIEGTYLGVHTDIVTRGLRIGFLLFLVSEVFLFLAFFWAYLHSSLSPSFEIGSLWPPAGISPISYTTIPLLNTIILLGSGFTVTWSHSCLLHSDIRSSSLSLCLTITLGVIFGGFQIFEYHSSSFCISDSVYGSTFFMTTGLHGLHVFFGALFLLVSLFRLSLGHFSPQVHYCFLFSAWYWHFVDVI